MVGDIKDAAVEDIKELKDVPIGDIVYDPSWFQHRLEVAIQEVVRKACRMDNCC